VRIDELLPGYDFAERHEIELRAPIDRAWEAVESVDLARPFGVRLLMGIRSLPELVRRPGRWRERPLTATLADLERNGFGRLAEEPGREVVLGVEGRFWRLSGNLEPFERRRFERPVPAGLARALWNFRVDPIDPAATLLVTETRIVCGDAESRRRFRRYWRFVRPGSGLIRRWLLAEIRRQCARLAAGAGTGTEAAQGE